MNNYPNIHETIDLMATAEPIGTPEDNFARGSNELKYPTLLRVADYVLTVVYLALYGWGLYALIKWILNG